MYTYCETFTDIVLYKIIDCEKSVVKDTFMTVASCSVLEEKPQQENFYLESFLQSRFGGETVEEFKYEVVLSQALNQENQ